MGRRPYSEDVRSLVVGEVEAGASRRAAARRFKVSASSAIRWVDRLDETGSVSCEPRRAGAAPPGATYGLAVGTCRQGARPDFGRDRRTALEGPRGAHDGQLDRPLLQAPQDQLQKKRCTQPNKIGPTSPRPGRASRPAKQGLIPGS
jgi:hypothetical protein